MTGPVVVERRIDAPPAAVFEYLIDPSLLAAWLGAACTLDPTPGGRFEMLSPNGMTAAGEVAAVLPDEKVSFTWGWTGHPGLPPGSTLVEIELIPDEGGTLVRLTHSELDPDEKALHRRGWQHYMGRLAVAVGGGDPGMDRGAAG